MSRILRSATRRSDWKRPGVPLSRRTVGAETVRWAEVVRAASVEVEQAAALGQRAGAPSCDAGYTAPADSKYNMIETDG
jgi:hypothetical protein